jgi:muramoyltetrapeptide carboxypeptidase
LKRNEFILKSALAIASVPLVISCAENVEPFTILPKKQTVKKKLVVGITAPCGAVFNKRLLQKSILFLENEGFEVILGKTLDTQHGYFSDTDEHRAQELNEFFKNKSIDIILCARGGWGCNRLIPFLDLDVIRTNPKALVGFSDVTTLLNYIHFKTGLITYHGNVAYSSWGTYSYKSFKDTILNQEVGSIQNYHDDSLKVLSPGTATGKLIGGNLTVLCSMIGTDYEPLWKGNIICIEETHEEPYRVDRLLNQMKDSKVFEQCSGIILGQFNKCAPDEPSQSFSLDEVIHQYFKNIDIPVISNASFGHVTNKFTIPIGMKATISSNDLQIKLLGS